MAKPIKETPIFKKESKHFLARVRKQREQEGFGRGRLEVRERLSRCSTLTLSP